MTTELNYEQNEKFTGAYMATNRLYSITSISATTAILGFDKFLVKLENGKPSLNYLFPIRSVEKINNEFIIGRYMFFCF